MFVRDASGSGSAGRFAIFAALILAAGFPFVTRGQSDTITIDAPPGGLISGTKTIVLNGSVREPSIKTVYIARLGSPVIVLGRLRRDLPGVPFPVINGRFTGYASFLEAGDNTIRIIAFDAGGMRNTTDIKVNYNRAFLERPVVALTLTAKTSREIAGRRIELNFDLVNNTKQEQAGVVHLEVSPPTGGVALTQDTRFNLPGGTSQSIDTIISTNTLQPLGICKATATVRNTAGEKLSSDFMFFETYQAEDYPFRDVSIEAGIHFLHQGNGQAAGASWADFDRDGNYDLFATSERGPAKLFRNRGDGTFADVTQVAGLGDQLILPRTRAGIWGDYDNDRYPDLFITLPANYSRLFHNNRDGTFSDVTGPSKIRSRGQTYSAAWGDYDNDGLLDLYVILNSDFNQLYHNNGDGTFSEVAEQVGVDDLGDALGAQWIDYDDDGDVDLFVINDFSAFTGYPGTIYRNDGPDGSGGWRFRNVGDLAKFHDVPLYGMGLGVADYDNDGDQDFFVSSIGIPGLFRNDGGVFSDATFGAGVTMEHPSNGPYAQGGLTGPFPNVGWWVSSWGVQFWDYDLDGWPDLHVGASGMTAGDYPENYPIAPFSPNWAFHNNHDGTFTSVGPMLGLNHPGRTRSVAMADYDNDGDLDIYLANNSQYGVLLRNDLGRENNWIKIVLRGTVSNRDAIGSKVSLTAGGLTQRRLFPDSDPYCSQPAPEMVFGLGKSSKIDTITIRWPRGKIQTLTGIDSLDLGPTHKLIITEPS